MKLLYWVRYNFIKILVVLVIIIATFTTIYKLLPKSLFQKEAQGESNSRLKKYSPPKGYSTLRPSKKKSLPKKTVNDSSRIIKKIIQKEKTPYLSINDLPDKSQIELSKVQRRLFEMDIDPYEVHELLDAFLKKNKKKKLIEADIIAELPEHIKKILNSTTDVNKETKKEKPSSDSKKQKKVSNKKEYEETYDNPYAEEKDTQNKKIKDETEILKKSDNKKQNPDDLEDNYKEEEY